MLRPSSVVVDNGAMRARSMSMTGPDTPLGLPMYLLATWHASLPMRIPSVGLVMVFVFAVIFNVFGEIGLTILPIMVTHCFVVMVTFGIVGRTSK